MLNLPDDILESLKQLAPRERTRKNAVPVDDPVALDLLKHHKSAKSESVHAYPALPKPSFKKSVSPRQSSFSEQAGRGVLSKLWSSIRTASKGKEGELGAKENTSVDAIFPPLNSKDELGVKQKGPVTLDDIFCLEKVITRECFGELWAATYRHPRHKKNREPVLMRLMDKKECSTDIIAKELEIIKTLNNIEFTVQLLCYFQTLSHYVIVMKHVTKGTLKDHVMMVRAFSEMVARFYAAEIAEALFGLHYKGIIHRSLSLDNVLICDNGHIMVSDFGHSLQVVPDSDEQCEPWPEGSSLPQFPAPELLMLETYDKAVDWWSYGIILYRMICGEIPFPDLQTYIEPLDVESELEVIFKPEPYPHFISPCATHFLTKLLHRDRTKRLGSGRHEENDITNMTFFHHVDWSLLRDHLVPPPFNFICHVPSARRRVLGICLPYSPEEPLKREKLELITEKPESVDIPSPVSNTSKTELMTDLELHRSSYVSHSTERLPSLSLPDSTEATTDSRAQAMPKAGLDSRELSLISTPGRRHGAVTFDLPQNISHSSSSSNIVTEDKTSGRKSKWSSKLNVAPGGTGVEPLSSSSPTTPCRRFRALILSSLDTIRRRHRGTPRPRFDSKW